MEKLIGHRSVIFCFLFISLVSLSPFSINPATPGQINVIPKPYKMILGKGSLNLTEKSSIIINQSRGEVLDVATEFQSRLRSATGWSWEIKEATQVKSLRGHIFLRLLPSRADLSSEGYELGVKANHIILDASSATGLFYGLQTLWQLFPSSFEISFFASEAKKNQIERPGKTIQASSLSLPIIQIIDKPRFR